MPIKVEKILEYAKEYEYRKTKSDKMLGGRLLGVFEGAIPKEKTFEKKAILSESIHIVIPTCTDHIYADKRYKDIFLYPIDCLMLTLAKSENAILITRDRELLSPRLFSSYSPENFLKENFPRKFKEKVELHLKI